jgi:hypothetical protein
MVKYTTKIGQPQFVGKVKINPKGGELTEKQVEEIKADPWGKELIEMELLVIAGTKAPDKDPDKTASGGKGNTGQEGK